MDYHPKKILIKGIPMKNKCPKCNGKLVYERFQEGSDVYYGCRCVNCGLIIDPEILINRMFGGVIKPRKRSGRKRKNFVGGV